MDRRTFLTSTLGATVALALGACTRDQPTTQETGPQATGQGTPSPAGSPDASPVAARPTLRLPGEDAGFPSPFTYQRGPGYWRMSFIYDTLLWVGADGEFLPWLASDMEASDDGLLYTFTLRDDVRWHDGEPFTADDVVFTFEYFQAQTLSPEVIVQPGQRTFADQVTAPDERTVEIRLAEPDTTFVDLVAAAVPIVPRHVWSDVDDAARAQDPALLIGTGPYRLESYTSGEGSYLYTANDDYFLGAPFVQRIEYRTVGDPLAAVLAGEADAADQFGLRPDALAPFQDTPPFAVLEGFPGAFQLGLYWNLARGGALADPRFRHACAMAIDRGDLVERLFGGNGAPGNPGWIPPGDPFHVDVEQYAFDPAAANQLLDEAGYPRQSSDGPRQGPDGEPLRFELLVTTGPPLVAPTADLLTAALGQLGIELSVQPLDTPSFNQRVIAGETELSLITAGGLRGYPDYMRRVYASFTEITQHAQGYENAEFDELAREQLATLDVDERMEIVARMQQIVAADLPLLPLYYPTPFLVYNAEVFDAWYYTEGGFAGNIPTVYNKHAFITGRQDGLEIRPSG
ncbi:MAG: ABC transporter substrate-binding protein [Egibacteraceae bacterium]